METTMRDKAKFSIRTHIFLLCNIGLFVEKSGKKCVGSPQEDFQFTILYKASRRLDLIRNCSKQSINQTK
jgi:hypothetical protein